MSVTINQFSQMNMVYQKFSFDYFLNSMEKLGVKQFELWCGIPHFYNDPFVKADVQGMKKKVAERGLKIVCVTPEQCIYPFNISASDDDLRKRSVDYFCNYIRATAELGVEKMLCGAGWGDYEEPYEDGWARMSDSMAQMIKVAEECDVKLAFEILQYWESNLVYDFAKTKRVFDQFDSKNFCLCVDTVPVTVEGKTLEDYFQEFGDRIIHIHLTDGNPTGHVPCGMGTGNLKQHIMTLNAHDYKGYITQEIGGMGTAKGPEEATEFGINTVKRLLQEIG